MTSANVIEAGDENFDQLVLASGLPSLVDFWGPSCAPCIASMPVVERLAEKYRDRLNVVKVNVNACPNIALKYAVQSLPTLVLVKGGKVLGQYRGRIDPASLDKFVQQAL
ncbi:MAG: thiol reductase thioredoxin [Deltaproteobacteria bacterium]|nr:thiol reductase thioredoxin [Deltaproteobacteria bacterium]